MTTPDPKAGRDAAPEANPPGDGDTNTPEREAARVGAELTKLEGSVFVRITGAVDAGLPGGPVAYRLVPLQGVLAKPGKWRKLPLESQIALVRERVHPKTIDALNRSVIDFVVGPSDPATNRGLDVVENSSAASRASLAASTFSSCVCASSLNSASTIGEP